MKEFDLDPSAIVSLGEHYSKRLCQEIQSHLPTNEKHKYGFWLSQEYYYVRQSTRISALAAARVSLAENAQHFGILHHLSEERGHEDLAHQDLQNLGLSLAVFRESLPIQILYQSMYYMVDHISPYCIVGYALVLEGINAVGGLDMYKIASKNFGESASKFLKVHSEVDIDHWKADKDFIYSSPSLHWPHIAKACAQAYFLYDSMLKSYPQNVSLNA